MVSRRLKGLSQVEFEAIFTELNALASRMMEVGNVIGPAFGAKWGDKALDLYNKTNRLKWNVDTEHYKRGPRE